MISPAMLCDTYTLFGQATVDPDDPFAESGSGSAVVFTRVRLSQSSGDRAVDAQGDSSARQAILFLFYGITRADDSLQLPEIAEGDKLVSGEHVSLPESDTAQIWTVKGVKKLKAKDRLHHMEVSLV